MTAPVVQDAALAATDPSADVARILINPGMTGPQSVAALQALPVAIYTTDAEGRLTFYNNAAAALWGFRPEIGKAEFCGSWKLFRPDGTPIRHDECPMATVLRTGKAIAGAEAMAERPDGTRVRFMAHPTPLFDKDGVLTGAVNMLVDINDRQGAEERLRASESRFRGFFENARVAVWEEDFSQVVEMLDQIRASGVSDIRSYFRANPDRLSEAIRRVKVVDVNPFAIEMFEADDGQQLKASLGNVFLPETRPVFIEELVAIWNGSRRFESETVLRTLTGRRVEVTFTMAFEGERCEQTLISLLDISARKEAESTLIQQRHRLETLDRIARAIATDFDLESIVQTVTDAATDLSGAKFGAFFYNLNDEKGESYTLYSLSGAPREAFERFGMPRNTPVFEPTFRGTSIVRSDDIRTDPRYGRNAPHKGMPKGHMPVVSYLAVPVVSRTGEVHGGLFLGHDRPGVFTEDSEKIVASIAAHAAVAIDNAQLLQAAKVEVEDRRRGEMAARQLASIVESSDDAIVAKNLDGIITNWNKGAERLFGYSAAEAIGKPVTMLIPIEQHDEEPKILARIRRGERIEHYETMRQRKDGSLVAISLAVSPVRDSQGTIVGASKIARDITERRRAEEQQRLLLREMNHRVKNLFSLASGVVTLTSRYSQNPKDMAEAVRQRIGALAKAHELTLPTLPEEGGEPRATTLEALLRTISTPYLDPSQAEDRFAFSGPAVIIGGSAVTSFALLLHEFATNAAKYGALSAPAGHVTVNWEIVGEDLRLSWREEGGPEVPGEPAARGFGTVLADTTVARHFNGQLVRNWRPVGLTAELTVPLAKLGR